MPGFRGREKCLNLGVKSGAETGAGGSGAYQVGPDRVQSGQRAGRLLGPNRDDKGRASWGWLVLPGPGKVLHLGRIGSRSGWMRSGPGCSCVSWAGSGAYQVGRASSSASGRS